MRRVHAPGDGEGGSGGAAPIEEHPERSLRLKKDQRLRVRRCDRLAHVAVQPKGVRVRGDRFVEDLETDHGVVADELAGDMRDHRREAAPERRPGGVVAKEGREGGQDLRGLAAVFEVEERPFQKHRRARGRWPRGVRRPRPISLLYASW